MATDYLVLRIESVRQDPKLRLAGSNGRKVAVARLWPGAETPLRAPEWRPAAPGEATEVLEVGEGGCEICTFTEAARQQRHLHRRGTEIYTVLEGAMRIRVADGDTLELRAGDEVVVLPGVWHEVLPHGTAFLTRVHSIQCGGAADKFTE